MTISTQPGALQTIILGNASYHTQLINSFTELGHAPAALKAQKALVSDLRKQLSASEKKIVQLIARTTKERYEHESYRDSKVRKLAARLSGRREQFEAQQSKEEQEYVEALQNEMAERDRRNTVQELLTNATTEREDLKVKVDKYTSLKEQIVDLYSQIFDGPTHAFPEEDRQEYVVLEVKRRQTQAKQSLDNATRACDRLTTALSRMDGCRSCLNGALSYSRWDMAGGGVISDFMERRELSDAERELGKARASVNRAKDFDPLVESLAPVSIPHGDILSDVIFGNHFSSRRFHKKIKNAAAQVGSAIGKLKTQCTATQQRKHAASEIYAAVSEEVELRQQQLFDLRTSIFQRVVSQVPNPPSYEPPSVPEYSPRSAELVEVDDEAHSNGHRMEPSSLGLG